MRSFQSVQLLEPAADRGYPLEYLLSRVRGRRSRLVRDWTRAALEPAAFESASRSRPAAEEHTPEAIWRNLLREHRWLYLQMNAALRSVFAPYLLYAELRTLFIGFRHIRERKAEGTAELLSVSLLHPGLKRMLRESEKLEDAVSGVVGRFFAFAADAGEMRMLLEKEGLRGVEQQLTDRLLSLLVLQGLPPALRSFFSRLIDARNILSLYKAVRLGLSRPPRWISGGGIPESRLRQLLRDGDLFTVTALIRETTGRKVAAPEISAVEISLYRSITAEMRKEGREPLGEGLILDYLWRCSIEAMNLSVLAHCRDIERDAVRAELVY